MGIEHPDYENVPSTEGYDVKETNLNELTEEERQKLAELGSDAAKLAGTMQGYEMKELEGHQLSREAAQEELGEGEKEAA